MRLKHIKLTNKSIKKYLTEEKAVSSYFTGKFGKENCSPIFSSELHMDQYFYNWLKEYNIGIL